MNLIRHINHLNFIVNLTEWNIQLISYRYYKWPRIIKNYWFIKPKIKRSRLIILTKRVGLLRVSPTYWLVCTINSSQYSKQLTNCSHLRFKFLISFYLGVHSWCLIWNLCHLFSSGWVLKGFWIKLVGVGFPILYV